MWREELSSIADVEDGLEYPVKSEVTVRVSSPGELARVIAFSAEKGLKVHVVGGGRHHVGEKVRCDVAVSVKELRGVQEVSPEDLYVTVYPGTDFQELSELLRREGLTVPFRYDGTVGGLFSTNQPSHWSFFHGYPRDWLLGAELVTGLGERIRNGARTTKFSSGYKVWKALSGSLGKLGIYSSLTVRLIPLPESIGTVEAELDKLGQILQRRPWGVVLVRREEWKVYATFAGPDKYVKRVTEGFREREPQACEGKKVTSVLTPRGEELSYVAPLRGECVEVYYGTGYSRLFNGESAQSLRSRGLTVVGERGCDNDCFPELSKSFILLKEALDPKGIFV